MAPVGKNDIPAVAAFMTDFWHLVKATWKAEPGKNYCRELRDRTYGLIDRYAGNRFVNVMCLAYLDYIGERLKDMELETRKRNRNYLDEEREGGE